MDKAESRGMNLGSKVSIKRAAVSSEGERPSKGAGIGASGNICRLENISFSRRQDIEDEEVDVDQLMRARDVKDGAVLLLV